MRGSPKEEADECRQDLTTTVRMGCHGGIPKDCRDLKSGTPRKLLGERDFFAEFGLGAKASPRGVSWVKKAPTLHLPSLCSVLLWAPSS